MTSGRLMVRRFTLDDLDALARMQDDPEVMRHVGGVKDRATTEAMLRERILAYYDEHPGLGIWATHERSSGEFVGMHLLNHIRGEAHVQVGYVLRSEFWGRGYATEMCARVLRYGFGELGLPRIAAITDLPNVASQRVLLKAGLRRDGERSFAAYANGEPLAWFERSAGEWLDEHGGATVK